MTTTKKVGRVLSPLQTTSQSFPLYGTAHQYLLCAAGSPAAVRARRRAGIARSQPASKPYMFCPLAGAALRSSAQHRTWRTHRVCAKRITSTSKHRQPWPSDLPSCAGLHAQPAFDGHPVPVRAAGGRFPPQRACNPRHSPCGCVAAACLPFLLHLQRSWSPQTRPAAW